MWIRRFKDQLQLWYYWLTSQIQTEGDMKIGLTPPNMARVVYSGIICALAFGSFTGVTFAQTINPGTLSLCSQHQLNANNVQVNNLRIKVIFARKMLNYDFAHN